MESDVRSPADLELVINRTALIENLLDQIIETFVLPRKGARSFFWEIVLHTSILPLGAKVKVALAISQELSTELDQAALHGVVSLRNAFAHQATDANPVLTVGRSPEADRLEYTLLVISNSGRTSRKSRDAGLNEFNEFYARAKPSLVRLRENVRSIANSGASDTPK